MKREIKNPEVKVCGITNESDAISAVQAGADYLGYIMNYPESPRYMRPPQVQKIIDIVRRLYPNVQHVGVFVDATAETVNQVSDQVKFDVIQLHGQESDQLIANISATTWNVIELREEADLETIANYSGAADYLMIDAGKGAGITVDDTLLAQANLPEQFILAGGLNPENVAERVERWQPSIIDLSSGVEALPGKKDPDKLRALFSALDPQR